MNKMNKKLIENIFGRDLYNSLRIKIRKRNAIMIIDDRRKKKQLCADKLLAYYSENADREKYVNELDYVRKKGFSVFPYSFNEEYKTIIKNTSCGFDMEDEFYVIDEGKRLYIDILGYALLKVEQNIRSAHRYFTDNFHVEEGDIFIDIGAAEGLIGLEVVNKVEKCILVEGDIYWRKPLCKTYAPFTDKVKIISKFAGNVDDNAHITVDSILKNESGKNIFIKIDVEGNEDEVLAGMKNTLAQKNVRIVICTYHKFGDEMRFKKFFESLGFKVEQSQGYMLREEAPYFIRGIMRLEKYSE